jgi:hypothetical protein
VPCHRPLQFIVLSKNGFQFKRNTCEGTIVDTSKTGVRILIDFPLHPGDFLLWDDSHRPGAVHVAIVKWAKKEDTVYNVGLKVF